MQSSLYSLFNDILEAECEYYMMQLRKQHTRMFGRSTEKSDDLQLNFFNEMEANSKPEAEKPELSDCVERAPAKKKKKGAKMEHVKSCLLSA